MAFDANTKLMFKSGLQTTLDNLTSFVPGTFYLTEDTKRLYVGNKEGKADLLNSIVEFVPSLSKLEEASAAWNTDTLKKAHLNDLFYIQDSNILAVWAFKDGVYKWVQINPDTDTKLTSFESSVTASDNVATISSTVSASNGEAGGTINKAADVKISAGKKDGKNTVNVTASGTDTVVITGDTYSMSAAADGDNAKIALASALGQAGSEVSIVAGDNVTVAVENGGIKISSDKWVPLAKDSVLEVVDGKIGLQLKEGNEGIIIETAEQVGVYVGQGDNQSDKKFVALGGDLGTYTAEQIDAKIRNLNGMTYRSTVGPKNSATVSASFSIDGNNVVENNGTALKVSAGDMFMVVCETDAKGNPIPIDFNGYELITGDLIIACGTEGADGYIESGLAWDHIPSGNDTVIDTTFKFETDSPNHSIVLVSSKGDNNRDVGSIKLQSDGSLVLDSTGSDASNLITTIKHATITTTTPDAAEVKLGNGEKDITVLESITTENGHVTQVNAKKLTLPKYSLSQFESSNASTAKGAAIALSTVFSVNEAPIGEASFTLASESLSLSVTQADADSAPVVSADIVWGSF